MGCDILGHVEVREYNNWSAVVVADTILPRGYDAFGCLFGVRNYAHFAPVAASRGLPEDASKRTLAAVTGLPEDELWDIDPDRVTEAIGRSGFHSATWIAWPEICSIDYDEHALAPHTRVNQYRRGPDGALSYVGKSLWSAEFGAASGVTLREMMDGAQVWLDGQTWEQGDAVFVAERLRRRDALTGNWQLLFGIMRLLAERYGDDRVRLVVWFCD